jgi:hypothetical protein
MSDDATKEKFSRRRLLIGGGQGLLGLAAGTVLWRLALKDDFIARTVRKKLPYLKVSQDDLMRFATDYRQSAVQGQKKVIALCAVFAPIFRILYRNRPENLLAAIEDKIAESFLMSSDLFMKGGDTSLNIAYVRFYDPYRLPCGNPFANEAAASVKTKAAAAKAS